MLADYGSGEEFAGELARLRAGVIEVLKLLEKNGRLRLSGEAYGFWILLGWNEKGAKAMWIVTGTWAQHLGLESELQFLLSDYEDLQILYSEKEFTTDHLEELDAFISSHGIMPGEEGGDLPLYLFPPAN